jgi:short-subunit dehydrogenase
MSRPVALVTGASAGIGVEFAKQLAGRGYDLVLVARRRDRLAALAAEVSAASRGATAHVIVADLETPDAVGAIVAATERAGLTVDLLINNAGFGLHGSFADADQTKMAGMISLNVNALVALTGAYVPGMVARKRGGVINVASTAAFQPLPGMAVYGATKAFVLSFSEALHEEVRRNGVRVVALCPGATATEFFGIAGEKAAVGTKRTVQDVVRTGLDGLARNRAVAVDGFANKALAESVRLMPRSLILRVSARVMQAG